MAEIELALDNPAFNREEKGMKFGLDRTMAKTARKQRVVDKNGKIRTVLLNVPKQNQLYFSDVFTTLLDFRWRYVFLVFSLAFLLSWLIFASIWWGIFVFRRKYHDIICIEKVDSWTSAFLFSLETQTTIGYGGRQITPACPEGVVCLIVQCIIGLLISSTMLGLIFAKVSRPQRRCRTVLFSKHAVINTRDGKVCLMFRVADVQKSNLLEAHIRVHLIRKYVTKEGEEIAFHQHNLSVTYDMEEDSDKLYLFLPMTVVHEIDEDSPLFNWSADTMSSSDFEVIVVLEGIVESTGMTLQARTSYLPEEIRWGHRFANIMSRNRAGRHGYVVDFSHFHDTHSVQMTRCSAKEYYARGRRSEDEPEPQKQAEEAPARDEFEVVPAESPSESENITPALANGHAGVSTKMTKL